MADHKRTVIVRATDGEDGSCAQVKLAGVREDEAGDPEMNDRRREAMQELFRSFFGTDPTDIGIAVLPYHRETDEDE